MVEKIYFFIEFRMLQPIRFAFFVLYIWLIVCGVIREFTQIQQVIFGGIVIYAIWFVLFSIKAYIINSGNKFLKYSEKKVVDISIEDMIKIRNRAYNKILMKLEFKSGENEIYYGKYICDPLYFETYLKSKLCRELKFDIRVWHDNDNKKYFIDVPNVMRKVAGVEREDYKKDLLKGQPANINIVPFLMVILLFVDILLLFINIVECNLKGILFLVCTFVIISFVIYMYAKKDS